MLIESIKLENFRQFQNESITFADGSDGYEDILNADGFDSDILKNSSCYPYYYIYR